MLGGRNDFAPTHLKSEIMQQIDKGDKPLLTFFLATSDDKKFIQIINHSTKTTASHHANNSFRDQLKMNGVHERPRQTLLST